ncbi:MAG: PqqD family protein [Thermofilaceae archaeon]
MAPQFKKSGEKEQQVTLPLEVLLKCKPIRNPSVSWEKKDEDEVVVKVKLPESKPGLLSGFVKDPTEKKYALDKVGSYVWEQLDGEKTVEEVVELLTQRFKFHRREAQTSLLAYLQILAQRGLIMLIPPSQQVGG